MIWINSIIYFPYINYFSFFFQENVSILISPMSSCLDPCLIFRKKYAQSAGAVEYISAAEFDSPLKSCPGYDTKQSEDEVPVMLKLWEM